MKIKNKVVIPVRRPEFIEGQTGIQGFFLSLKFTHNYSYLIFFLCVFLSRIFFINTDAVFFDSWEYIHRFQDASFLHAVSSGHLPIHAGYIILFWPIYHISSLLHLNPLYSVLFLQTVMATFAIAAFYLTAQKLVDKKTAWVAAIIFSLLPLFWITNGTVMIETTYVSFFAYAVYFYVKILKEKTIQKPLVFSFIFTFGFSLLTHLAIVLWIPLFLILAWYINPKRFKVSALILEFSVILGSFVSSYFVAQTIHTDLITGLQTLYLSKSNEYARYPSFFYTAFVYLRNFIIPLLRNNTFGVVFIALISLVLLFLKKRFLSLVIFLWILPAFIANQWWDSLFYGRHALIASFGLSLAAAILVAKKKYLTYILIAYLVITTLPALLLLKQPAPYIQLADAVRNLPKNSLYIESHFARPQVQEVRHKDIIYVEEPAWDKASMKKSINNYLARKKRVFISSQALSEPYGLYSGPYLHTLSLSYKNDFVLRDELSQFRLRKFRTISKADNLVIYEIIKGKPGYPTVPSMKKSYRRMDYTDPFTQFWFLLK